MDRRNLLHLLLALSMLLTFSLACAQSGDILTPAEATQKAEIILTAQPGGDAIVSVEGALFAPGDQAVLTSEGHLVGLFQEPTSKNAYSFATRGDEVTITSSMEVEGVVWYRIESTAGNGWLPESNLETP